MNIASVKTSFGFVCTDRKKQVVAIWFVPSIVSVLSKGSQNPFHTIKTLELRFLPFLKALTILIISKMLIIMQGHPDIWFILNIVTPTSLYQDISNMFYQTLPVTLHFTAILYKYIYHQQPTSHPTFSLLLYHYSLTRLS